MRTLPVRTPVLLEIITSLIGVRDCHVLTGRLTTMGYVWDTFDIYDLEQSALEKFLREKFGPYDFYIRVSEDNCKPKMDH